MNPFAVAGAVILTLLLGAGASIRVQSDWDPDEGLPTWPTIAALGLVTLAAWIGALGAV